MTKFHDYVKDGIYRVGQYGLSCDEGTKNIIKEIEADERGDEDHEHFWSFDIPEGSKIMVTKEKIKDRDFMKIEVIEIGDGEVPFDMDEAEDGKIYYSTEESAFGSGNVEFIK